MEESVNHKQVSEEGISEIPPYETCFSVAVGSSSFSATYRFHYRKEERRIEMEGRVIGSESQSCLGDEVADRYAAEQGKDALEAAVQHLKKKYPEITNIDVKPCCVGTYNAW